MLILTQFATGGNFRILSYFPFKIRSQLRAANPNVRRASSFFRFRYQDPKMHDAPLLRKPACWRSFCYKLSFCHWACCVILAASAGCASARKSDTARTGTEQMLISNAVDQALAKIDFRPIGGQKVFLDEKYMDSVDKTYVLASVRHRILKAGAELVEKPTEAELIVEVRSGAVGTDDNELVVGIPPLNLGPLMSIPELSFFKRHTQIGTAKIGLVAYDAKTRHVVGEGAVTRAQATNRNWFALGMGPYNSGNLKQEIDVSNLSADQFPLEVNGDGSTFAHAGQVHQTVFLSPSGPEGRSSTRGLSEEGESASGGFTPVSHDRSR